MKVGFFMQNVKRGGLDTFVLNLLSNWPSSERLILFCNRSHPGLDDLKRGLSGRVQVVDYDFWIAQDIAQRLAHVHPAGRFVFRSLYWLFGLPYLVHKLGRLFKETGPDRLIVINGGYPGGDACLAATIAWRRYRPRQPAWHNFHNLVLPYSTQAVRRWKEVLIDRCVARSAAGFVTVSEACMKTLHRRSAFHASAKAFIYNGISRPSSSHDDCLPEHLGVPANSRLVLMLAVYEPRKGHEFMISVMKEVVRRVPQACLLICGDGSPIERKTVEALRTQSGIPENIVLRGHQENARDLLARADVLVMPSQEQESFGYAAVEALAMGRPVVVTDTGGLPEVVDDGKSGYVVARGDHHTFALRIVELLQNATLREQMGKSGRERYEQLFLASRMSLEYSRLIEKGGICDRKSEPHPGD